jgi:hypothetical protein
MRIKKTKKCKKLTMNDINDMINDRLKIKKERYVLIFHMAIFKNIIKF